MSIYNVINEVSCNAPIFKIEKGFPYSIKMNSRIKEESSTHYNNRKKSFDILSKYISNNLNNINNENIDFKFSFIPVEDTQFNKFLLYATRPSLVKKNRHKSVLNGVHINIYPGNPTNNYTDSAKDGKIPIFSLENNSKNDYNRHSINKNLIEFHVLLLMINKLLGEGKNNDTLSSFYKDEKLIQDLKDDYEKGFIECNNYTEMLLDCMIGKKEDEYSFFVSTPDTKKNIKEISMLTKKQLIFWIENRNFSPFINLNNFSLQHYLFALDIWINCVKKEDTKVILKIDNIIKRISDIFNSFEEKILNQYTSNGFDKFGKDFLKMSKENTFILDSIIKVFTLNNEDLKFEQLKLHNLYLLLLADKNPGMFLKGSTSYQLLKIFYDTASKVNYDFNKFMSIVEFMSQNNSIPKFNRTQWSEFLDTIIQENIDIDENLTLYANAVIPDNYGSNFSNNYFIDKNGYNFTKSLDI